MILKNDPGNVKIWMNGQTKMNAYIGLWKNNPGNIKVNGENYKSKFKNNLLNIRLEKK